MRQQLSVAGFEQVVSCRDAQSGLHAIIAIHDTTLGPAVGGTRMMPYETEQLALADVLRLSRAMTYKAAAAGLDFGGGKAVIIGDPERDKTRELLLAYGRFLEALGGAFITGEDVGTTAGDMRLAAHETRYAIFPQAELDPTWETAFLTARGVMRGIEASAREALGTGSLSGLSVAVQGVGKVGGHLARMLHSEAVRLMLCDVERERAASLAAELGAACLEPAEIYETAADVFCPCALGGVLNDAVIPRLRCRIVAGAANNQLAENRHDQQLWERGILYAPDYVINAGGLISALYEMGTWDRAAVMACTDAVYDRLLDVFALARRLGLPTQAAADRLVEERLQRARAEPRATGRP
ncbi:MAG: Glu/Leu/Phe/Val dehydrogenase dimerization domain-containing protein [Acidobacteriota bacterium]